MKLKLIRHLWRWLRFPFAIVAAVFVAGVVWVAWFLSGQRYQQMLTQQLSVKIGAEVRVASSRLSLSHGLGIQFNDVAMQRRPEANPFFTADRIEVLLDFSALRTGSYFFATSIAQNHTSVSPKESAPLRLFSTVRR